MSDAERIASFMALAQEEIAAARVLSPLRASVNGLDKFSTAATKYRYPTPAGRLAQAPSAAEVAAGVKEVATFIEQVKQHVRTESSRPRY